MLAPPFPASAIAAARERVKTHLRIEGAAEDIGIADKVETALALCEAFTGEALLLREWRELLPAGAQWQRLAGSPVAVIDGVEGVAADGATIALPVGNYAIDVDAQGRGWVRIPHGGGPARVRVTYQAGLAEAWDALPTPLTQGAVLLAAYLFEARAIGGAPPAAVAALWRPWRRLALDVARRLA